MITQHNTLRTTQHITHNTTHYRNALLNSVSWISRKVFLEKNKFKKIVKKILVNEDE